MMEQGSVSASSFTTSSAVATTDGPLEGAESRKKKPKSVGSKPAKKFQCSECKQSCSSRADLIRHLRVHTGEKPFGCDICSKSFSVKSTLVVHKKKHTREKAYHCDLCPRKFTWKSVLTRHRKVIHFPEQVTKHPCGECGKSFTTKNYLLKHQLIHQGRKPYTCVFCSKKFRHKCGVREHIRRHVKEKSYFCKDCDKSYFKKELLKVHRSGHTGNKYFKCPHPNCTVAFWYRPLMIAHRRQFHKEDVGVSYTCGFCADGFEFIRKQSLYDHVRRHHLREKGFFCRDCDKCFVAGGELQNHFNRMHHKDGEKKYTCYHCDMAFYSAAQRSDHKRLVHQNDNNGN